jgi:hypothetical protein
MATTLVITSAFLGMLFQQGKEPNTLLRLIGGISKKIVTTSSREFPTNVAYNLRAAGQNTAREGASAPPAESVGLTQATNVIQIHQERISLTYLAQSDNTISGVVAIPSAEANGTVTNPRSTEWQLARKAEIIQRDLNWSFHNGVFANPADPSGTALKTRGLLTAITTNLLDKSAVALAPDQAAQIRGWVTDLVELVTISNGYSVDQNWVLMCGTSWYANISASWGKLGTLYYTPETTVAGIKVRQIVTDFGTITLALDPHVPANTVGLYDLNVVRPVGLEVVEDGVFKGCVFAEPLGKTGSANDWQAYAQIGLDHGPEFCHGKIIFPAGMKVRL